MIILYCSKKGKNVLMITTANENTGIYTEAVKKGNLWLSTFIIPKPAELMFKDDSSQLISKVGRASSLRFFSTW